MTPEQRVAVVTDSSSSIRPEDKIAKEHELTIVPLQVSFYEGGREVSYSDLDISPQEFYRKMRDSEALPKTSGVIQGPIYETCLKLSEKTNQIISIHITSVHSAAYGSAVQGAKLAQEERPELFIEVIDSRQISAGTLLLVLKAAELSQKSASLEEVKEGVLATIPKIQLYATLSSLKNLVAGGRVPAAAGWLGSMLKINPILGIDNGKLVKVGAKRTTDKARQELIRRVEGEDEEIVKMAILHTNDLDGAKQVKEALAVSFSGEIPIFDAGPALGVHAGEGAVGVAFQTV